MSEGTFIGSGILAIGSAVLLIASSGLSKRMHRIACSFVLTSTLVIGVWLVKDHESAVREWYLRYNIGHILSDQIFLIEGGRSEELSRILNEFDDRAPEWVRLRRLQEELSQASRALETKTEQDGAGQPATNPESESEGGGKPQPEEEGRSR